MFDNPYSGTGFEPHPPNVRERREARAIQKAYGERVLRAEALRTAPAWWRRLVGRRQPSGS